MATVHTSYCKVFVHLIYLCPGMPAPPPLTHPRWFRCTEDSCHASVCASGSDRFGCGPRWRPKEPGWPMRRAIHILHKRGNVTRSESGTMRGCEVYEGIQRRMCCKVLISYPCDYIPTIRLFALCILSFYIHTSIY